MKQLEYILSQESLSDLQSLYIFLKNANEEHAFDLIRKKINIAIQLLREFPNLGILKPSGVRIYTVLKTKYVIVFQVRNNVLEILRIFHTSRKWEKE